MAKYQYNYFYKITNNLNGHFYYGVHSTNDLEDGYMGSGKRLHYAYKKYGIENFTKEILKFFDTAKEAYEYEAKIVNESLVNDDNCYNIQQGGRTFSTKNCIVVKYKNTAEFFVVSKDEYNKNKNLYDTNWSGRHHKQSSKDKIRQSMKKTNSTGKRTWINKDGVVKYLLNKYLQEYLDNGWELGRAGYKPRKNGQGKIIK